VSISSIPRGSGLFEITDDDGDRAITNIRRLAGGEVPPGRFLVNTAAILLGVLDLGLFAVSFAAQDRYIFHAKHDSWPALIEAAALDAGMVVFSLLALGLARGGQAAPVERALILVCAIGSAAMNYAAADVSSPRSVAAYVMPPVFLAVVTDRVIAVVRRHMLGMDAERSAWAALGRAMLVVLAAAARLVLYGLRLVIAPRSTLYGLRRRVLLATPLPAAPVPVPVLPSPSPVFLPPPPQALEGDGDEEPPALRPPACFARTGRAAGDVCTRPRPCTRHEPGVRLPGETKKAHLARLYGDHPDRGNRAVREELISKNPAALVRVSKPRKSRKVKPWSVEEAQHFLASALAADDPLYAAFVLILVLGLRKGEVLGLTWERVDLDAGELYVGEQLQRVSGRLIRRETKTEASDAPLPLPAICIAALKLRRAQQDRDRERHADRWRDTGLVFTTRYGTPIEPRNFNRSFDYRIAQAQVRRITVHGTRKTCGTLLAALDVHPRVAMQILRHSRIAVTMEIYTEATSEATRNALKRLGDELSPPGTAEANTEVGLSGRQSDEPDALDPEQP
jgi:integrase